MGHHATSHNVMAVTVRVTVRNHSGLTPTLNPDSGLLASYGLMCTDVVVVSVVDGGMA